MVEQTNTSEQIDALFFCNPILDITQDDQESVLLNKYNLTIGMATLATPEQIPIINEIFGMSTHTDSLGGSALNSSRALAYWMNKNGGPGKVMYMGGIGKDNIGTLMKEKVKAAGVDGNFAESDDTPTGCCACVVVGSERTLCVNLGAAKKYPTSHLEANLVSSTKFGYFSISNIFLHLLGVPW